MSKNECLSQSRSVCAYLLVCISFCTPVFAGGYYSSSWQGFDSVKSAAVESSSVNPSSNDFSCLSLLTLLQVTPVTDQKVTLSLNAADACHTFKWKSKTSDAILYASFVNGQGLTATDIASVFGQLLPADVLWTMGQYEILGSVMNSSADQNVVSQNTFSDKWILHAIRIADSTTSGILAAGTGLLKQI